MVAKQTVKVVCESCSGSGVYCGLAEPKGVAVVCIRCGGTGCRPLTFEPFEARKRRTDVREVRLSAGTFIATGTGPRGTSVTYDEFWNGKMPQAK